VQPPLVSQHRHDRIVPQLVVVVEVLVTEHNANHPLPHQRLDRVLNQLRLASIAEAGGEAIDGEPLRLARSLCRTTSFRLSGAPMAQIP
jgi:hypothetical protein